MHVSIIKLIGEIVLKFWYYIVIAILLLGLLFLNGVKKSNLEDYQANLIKAEQKYLSLEQDMKQQSLDAETKLNALTKSNQELSNKYQEVYNEKSKVIATLSNAVKSESNGLSKQLNSISSDASKVSYSTNIANSLLKSTSESFAECTERYTEVAGERDQLQESVTTLKNFYEDLSIRYENEQN